MFFVEEIMSLKVLGTLIACISMCASAQVPFTLNPWREIGNAEWITEVVDPNQPPRLIAKVYATIVSEEVLVFRRVSPCPTPSKRAEMVLVWRAGDRVGLGIDCDSDVVVFALNAEYVSRHFLDSLPERARETYERMRNAKRNEIFHDLGNPHNT